MSQKPTFIYRIASRLSIYDLNGWWQDSFNKSIFLSPFITLSEKIRSLTQSSSVNKFGNLLQNVSLLISLLLFLSLGLPQFANDKVGLALIAMAGLFSWAGGWVLGGKQKRRLEIIDFVVILYLFIYIVAAFSSHYFIPSLKGLAKVIIYIGSYFLFSTIVSQSKKNTLSLLGSVLLIGLLLSLHGLYQYKVGVSPLATWEDPSVQTRGTRIYSTLGNPNLLAGFLIPIAPIALGFGSYFLAQKKWLFSVPIYMGAALITLACVLTGSRGGYLALFACLAAFCVPAFCWMWKKSAKFRPAMIISVIVILAGAVFALTQIPAFQTRLSSIFAGREHSSNSFRMNVWVSSLEMFKDSWWIGSGVGNEAFRLAYGLYMTSGYDALGTYCVPLEIACECGIFGLLVFAFLVIACMARAHLIFWNEKVGVYRWIILGVAASIIGLATHGMVDTVFYRPQVHFIFWLLIAILAMDNQNTCTESVDI